MSEETDKAVCPHCGVIDYDIFPTICYHEPEKTEGVVTCKKCNKKFGWEGMADIRVTFNTWKEDTNVG